MCKLLLIDGNAILHRAYYALPDWRNRSGEATAGVYGFLSMMLKAIEDLRPTHLAVVFDTPEPTFRHLLYVGYQTTREKERQVSEDIWGQVEKLKIVFEKMQVPVFSLPGFEADDVIGSLAIQAIQSRRVEERESISEVIIITGDKDLMQLVNEKVKLYMPQKGLSDGVIVDEEKVMEKMGVHPNQIIDYKGLVGDASDNYPGVSGIGPKTAVHLLAEYGTLEKIYQQLANNAPSDPPLKLRGGRGGGDINAALRDKLVGGYEAALLSQKLATIKLDVPVTINISQCSAPSAQRILEVLKELGYKSLIKRMGGNDQEVSEKQAKLFD